MKYPPALEGREVTDTYVRMLAGDKYAYEDFIEGHMRLASSIAHAHCPAANLTDDLVSEAMVALVEGVNHLKKNEHPNPVGYLILKIRGQVINFLNRFLTPPHDIEPDKQESKYSGFKEVDLEDEIKHRIPENLRPILELRRQNYSRKEIAEKMSYAESTIARKRKEIADAWKSSG